MNIKIDSRESKLKDLIQKNITDSFSEFKSKIHFENLDIGDIVFIKQNNMEKNENHAQNEKIEKNKFQNILALERKTISDLKNSLRDGRFSEQKKRLAASDFIHKGYIIEGNSKDDPGFQNMLQQIIIRIQLKDRMCIFQTLHLSDTIQLISEINRKIEKDPKLYNFTLVTNYVETLNVCKKMNLTPSICFILQLSQIPGISKKIAENLASLYPNWNLLSKSLEDKKEFLKSTKNMNIGPKKFEQLENYILKL